MARATQPNAGFAKDMGKMAGELKDVPKEFQVRKKPRLAKTARATPCIPVLSCAVLPY